MRFLRTNTAVIISVGPFYDKTDGVTPETSLTITNERITLVADTDAGSAPTLILDNVTGATAGTDNDLNYITGQDNGMMQLELSAANTNRLGRMILTITDAANHVPVFHEFMVLPAMIYDAFILGTDTLHADMQQILGTAVSTPATAGILDVNVKNIDNDAASASGTVTFPNATLASTTNITAGTITTATNVTTVNGLAANVITAAATAPDFGTEVAAAVWDMDATGHQTQGTFGQAIGDPAADTNTIFKATVTDATGVTVGTDTATLLTRMGTPSDLGGGATLAANLSDIEGQTDDIGAAGAGLTALATQASVNTIDDFLDTEIAAILAAVDTEVAAIKTKTDFLPSATAGAAGGVFIAGTNAPVTITGSGNALTVSSTGGAGSGISVTGHDAGEGISITGGINGRGVYINYGASIVETRNGSAALAVQHLGSAGASHAVLLESAGDGNGISVSGYGSGAGISVTGGATNGDGIVITGQGSGADIRADITGSLSGTIGGLTVAAVKDFFDTDSGTTFASAVAGSVVKEIADNAGGSSLTLGDIADAVMDEAADGATTLRQSIRLWNAALGGKASGLGTTTAVFRDLADSKDRITATVDSNGNRAAVTRDLT